VITTHGGCGLRITPSVRSIVRCICSLAFAGVGHASSTGPEAAIGVGIFPAVGAAGVVGIFPGVEDVAGRILPLDPVLVLLTLPFSPVPSCKSAFLQRN
jgi:hypothetical protein